MMTSFEFKLKEIIKFNSSRRTAVKAREEILSLLKKFDVIEIDIQGVNFTPSVADEIIGGLARLLGADSFKRKIKVKNVTESQVSLMKHVIARRL